MKPFQLFETILEYPSDQNIALVEGVTNEHIYDIRAGYIHISGTENYFEISFNLTFKIILKWFYWRIRWEFFNLFKRKTV